MNSAEVINFSDTTTKQKPFPHFCSHSVFAPTFEKSLVNWLDDTVDWELTKTEFYEQYEFSLFDITLPPSLSCLLESNFIESVEKQLETSFDIRGLDLVGATVHKLTDGQRIGVHNDFIGQEESHRLLVQLNRNWTEDKGGYLLLFHSANAEDISDIILPVSNSAFGFEISCQSNHAVSTVYDFTRYTLVYTFKRSDL